MYRCPLHFVDCKWELTTCASKHSLVYAIDEIQISDKKWGCARDKGSKAEPEFNVLISIWGLCWCNFVWIYFYPGIGFDFLGALVSPWASKTDRAWLAQSMSGYKPHDSGFPSFEPTCLCMFWLFASAKQTQLVSKKTTREKKKNWL